MKAILDTSAFINILSSGGITLLQLIINKYDEFIITTKLQEEYLSHMMSIKQLANVKKDDLMNVLHNFRKIPSIKNEVIQFLDLANRK